MAVGVGVLRVRAVAVLCIGTSIGNAEGFDLVEELRVGRRVLVNECTDLREYVPLGWSQVTLRRMLSCGLMTC